MPARSTCERVSAGCRGRGEEDALRVVGLRGGVQRVPVCGPLFGSSGSAGLLSWNRAGSCRRGGGGRSRLRAVGGRRGRGVAGGERSGEARGVRLLQDEGQRSDETRSVGERRRTRLGGRGANVASMRGGERTYLVAGLSLEAHVHRLLLLVSLLVSLLLLVALRLRGLCLGPLLPHDDEQVLCHLSRLVDHDLIRTAGTSIEVGQRARNRGREGRT